MQNPGVILHFLWTEGAALVDVIEPHAVGGELDHCGQLLLQLRYCLVQTDVQLRQTQTVFTLSALHGQGRHYDTVALLRDNNTKWLRGASSLW